MQTKKGVPFILTMAAIITVVLFSGCVNIEVSPTEEPKVTPSRELYSTPKYVSPTEEPKVTPSRELYSTPYSQSIVGNYKVLDIAGKEIDVVGNYNEIRILNSDVREIDVIGNYNTVYYPKDARPEIDDVGTENVIMAY
ncbi:MAG: DUF3060 domain-containing protein [Dehalococcoidia bacterium]|nr:MAG: DUF3060 domain-containing protein [Dehalococcoidia bacterium]